MQEAYDIVRFSPPAPVAAIEIRNAATGKFCANVPMLLDTGADVTLIPRNSVDQLQISIDPAQVYELMGFDGSRSIATAVYLDVIFLRLTFRGRYFLTDQPDGVLGRDILNHLTLTYNGPGLFWETTG